MFKIFSYIWIIRAALVYKQFEPSLEMRDCAWLAYKLLETNSLSTMPHKAVFADLNTWERRYPMKDDSELINIF